MAGFFRMFDQSQPGPGVSKNQPQKKRFFLFWELYGRKFWKLMVANLLYILVSLPVVTRGLAEVGLTSITRSYAREKHAFLPGDFFDAIKKNWKQALLIGILELVTGGIILFSLYFYWMSLLSAESFSFMSAIAVIVATVVAMLFVFARYYMYLQLITFKFSTKQLLRNSVLFAIGGMKQNLLITVTLAAVYALLVFLLYYFFWIALAVVIAAVVFVLPAFRSFLIQFTIFPLVKKTIIDPYYQEHPQEDIDKRLDLNLETETVPTDTEEAVFTDASEREEEVSVIPKQYSRDDMRRAKRVSRRDSSNADDDGTI